MSVSTVSKRIVVDIVVDGASGEQIAASGGGAEAATADLGVVRAADRQAEEPVRLDLRRRYSNADARPTGEPERGLRGADAVAGAPASGRGGAAGPARGDPHRHRPRLLRGRRPHRIRGGFGGWRNQAHRHVALQSGRDPDDRGPSGAGHRSGERGGGCRRLELLLCCDIIVAAEGAKMGDGHTDTGWFLPGERRCG